MYAKQESERLSGRRKRDEPYTHHRNKSHNHGTDVIKYIDIKRYYKTSILYCLTTTNQYKKIVSPVSTSQSLYLKDSNYWYIHIILSSYVSIYRKRKRVATRNIRRYDDNQGDISKMDTTFFLKHIREGWNELYLWKILTKYEYPVNLYLSKKKWRNYLHLLDTTKV